MKTQELNRLMQNLCRVGTIKELNTEERTVVVNFGELDSAALPWPASIGKNFIRWQPLRLGAGVSCMAPGGDSGQGFIVGQIYSNDIKPSESSEDIDVIEFEDGTKIQYDSSASELSIICTGNVELNANQITATSQGNATIESNGNVEVVATGSAKIEATGMAEIKATQIKMQDGSAGGVVCQSHVCSFTGGPHPQASATIIASN